MDVPIVDDGHNPFSTRYTRPGALDYHFAASDTAAQLVQRLRANGWWGQIVGPHGSGKSTLLATLLPLLADAGRQTLSISLHQGDSRLPRLAELDRLDRDGQMVVDGYEQLGRLSRWRLSRRCRRQSCGLLVTAHRDLGLPTIVVVEPSLKTLQHVVARLLPAGDGAIRGADIADAWQRSGGNMREALFALYDLYELRRREAD